MKFRFLGTGTSVGVPQIGCGCPVCTSPDPRDKRRRCGAYVTAGSGEALLIDTPPELRLACLEYGISKVDAVALTHAHMDHVASFDDIRRFNTINGKTVPCDPNSPGANGRTMRVIGKTMPCYALPETISQMHTIFPYISAKGGEMGLFRPQIDFIDNTQPFNVGSLRVEAIRVEHGFPCCGYLLREFGVCSLQFAVSDPAENSQETAPPTANCKPQTANTSLAYISDCHVIGDEEIEKLRGVDVLALNCLRVREHPTHLSLERSKEYIRRISPGRAYLVHMCHDFTHTQWLDMLSGTNIEPAYDGLEIDL